MKKGSLLLILFNLLLVSCHKETASIQPDEYFTYKVDGAKKSWGPGNALSGGEFECTFLKDTALFIAVKFGVESIGFYLKSQNSGDGTYSLNNNDKGFYSSPADYKSYATNANHTGTLTIKKAIFQSYGTIPILEGQFSFEAVDTTGRKTIHITEGKFLMEYHNQ